MHRDFAMGWGGKPYTTAATLAACNACNAFTLSVPCCNAEIPSAAARAAATVVIVGIRASTAARRIAFSSKNVSCPRGVLTIS